LDKFVLGKHLSREDITFTVDSMRLTIKWSKVIQFKDRTLVIEFPRMPGSVMCPVTATFRAFQLSASAPPNGPAFVSKSGIPHSPLSPCVFVKKVQECLKKVGIEPSQYSGHSFRRGGASWAYNIGIPLETIRQLGDWKSNACLAYISVSRQHVTDALLKMQTSVLR
jgi:integrase